MMPKYIRSGLCALALAAVAVTATACAHPGWHARIVNRFPHDRNAFTEGLVVNHGVVYESTGRYGHSSLRRVDLASGRVQRSRGLARRYFGEGLALAGDRLYQLTWKAGRGFVYDRDSLTRIGTFAYRGQGWGLTWDGTDLIMSDGSAVLKFIRPGDFAVVRRVRVHDRHGAVGRLNELEYIHGEIWANIWLRNRIVRIDPADGRVVAAIDAANLRAELPRGAKAGTLNGIAWDATSRRLFVTGKNWPRLFELAWPPGVGGE